MITEVNLIGITPEVIQDKDFEKIKDSFESRLDLLILRFKNKKEFNKHFRNFISLAKDINKEIVINSRHLDQISRNFNLHLNSKDLMRFDKRPIPTRFLLGASCHNDLEIKKAKKIGCDYLFISPINKAHGKEGIGWSRFKYLSELSACPSFALGGMKKENVIDAIKNGGQGVAGISLVKD